MIDCIILEKLKFWGVCECKVTVDLGMGLLDMCLAGQQGYIIFSLALSWGSYILQANYFVRHLCWITGQQSLEQKRLWVLESRNLLWFFDQSSWDPLTLNCPPFLLHVFLFASLMFQDYLRTQRWLGQAKRYFTPLSLSFCSYTLHIRLNLSECI